MSEQITNEDTWKIINSYFDKCHLEQLVKHHIESYNDFIQNQMKKTIEMFNPITIRSENTYDSDTGKISVS